MIEVRGLVKQHGSLAVLRGVSLMVHPGEVAVVIGPSGGGKSTLLRCINGLERFNDGEVQVGKLCLRAAPPIRVRSRTCAGGSAWCSSSSTCFPI